MEYDEPGSCRSDRRHDNKWARRRRRDQSESVRRGQWSLGEDDRENRDARDRPIRRRVTRWDVGYDYPEELEEPSASRRGHRGHSNSRHRMKKKSRKEPKKARKRSKRDEETILSNTLLEPLTAFVSDRGRLAIEMLKSVDPATRDQLLPQFKKLPDLEMEKFLTSKLKCMSRKRILATIEVESLDSGHELSDSSATSSEYDEEEAKDGEEESSVEEDEDNPGIERKIDQLPASKGEETLSAPKAFSKLASADEHDGRQAERNKGHQLKLDQTNSSPSSSIRKEEKDRGERKEQKEKWPRLTVTVDNPSSHCNRTGPDSSLVVKPEPTQSSHSPSKPAANRKEEREEGEIRSSSSSPSLNGVMETVSDSGSGSDADNRSASSCGSRSPSPTLAMAQALKEQMLAKRLQKKQQVRAESNPAPDSTTGGFDEEALGEDDDREDEEALGAVKLRRNNDEKEKSPSEATEPGEVRDDNNEEGTIKDELNEDREKGSPQASERKYDSVRSNEGSVYNYEEGEDDYEELEFVLD